MPTPFLKMNGSGNDFVVIDARQEPVRLTADAVQAIAARQNTVTGGCDQLIVMERSKTADVFMRIYNADGSQVDACGNATRCVAGLLEEELGRLPVSIATNAGVLRGLEIAYTPEEDEYVLVDMGTPKFDWKDIPLAMPQDQAAKLIGERTKLGNPDFVNMGNPHVVFFVADESKLNAVPLEMLGPKIENMVDIFPQRVNVSIATVHAAKDGLGHIIHARVWERGAGLTEACGTAACAMLAAANKRDALVTDAHLWFEPFGSFVTVQMGDDGRILLGGPVETEFTGMLNL